MAIKVTTDAGTLLIPGAYSTIKVEGANSGTSTTGVVMLVGEADSGPGFLLESDLSANAFGPDQFAAVAAKYGKGPLVDAFSVAAAPANDPNIQGAPSRIVLVKTNASAKAKAPLTVFGGATYKSAANKDLSLADKSYGKAGNQIYFTVDSATSEAVPTTGPFTWLLPIGATDLSFRVNGGAAVPLSLSALTTPSALVTAVDALAGIAASGGVNRAVLPSATGSLALTVLSGNSVRIDYTVPFAALPVAGDTLYIPATSVLSPAADANAGSYVVTSATASSVTATKLMDAAGTPGALTAPVAVSSTAVVATTDLQVYSPVTISLEAGNPVLGVGKALEVAELTSAADRLSNLAYALSASKVTWVSKSIAPKLLVSGSEYRARLNVNRQVDNIQESLESGGEVAFKVGYLGTSASLTVDDATLTTVVTGGVGTALTIDLNDYKTIGELATYINSQPGYKASAGNGILGQLPTLGLDNVSTGIASTHGEQPGRVKIDGYRFYNKINEESVLVQLQDSDGVLMPAGSGLPVPNANLTYLAGGTKGFTTDADVAAAYLALEKVRGNFLVPLFSRDAAVDIVDRLTDPASTYTIESINAGARTHVVKMSTLKARKNRQALLSVKGTFAAAKAAASNTAQFRCHMAFQDIRVLSADGTVKQFAPWMASVDAAGMQAAGFYRAIVRKFANVNGALQAAKDFDDQNDSQVEEALEAGLLILKKAETGGFYWVSDQSTYGKDSNFVYNSLQAVYAADLIALSTAQRMENAFVGQSVADITASLALTFLETIMEDLRRLKLIAASDDAPRGFKNATIKISAPQMVVGVEVKLAGAVYFAPISFKVSQVTQSA